MSSRYFLLILDGERKGEKVPLEEDRFTLGRKEKNDLVLPDPRVSGYHAEIVLEGDRWILRDLGSTNGTFLDGRRIDEVPLEHGDTFSVGVLRLRFVDREGGPLAAESQEVQVARVDQDLLEKAGRKRSLAPLLILLLLALGGGAWAFLYMGKRGKTGPKGNEPLEVAGNLLPLQAASFEEGGMDAWDLRAGRGAFDLEPGTTHSGEMAAAVTLEAGRPALLRLKEPLSREGGSFLRGGAFLRVEGEEARAALHILFFAAGSSFPVLTLSTPWVEGGKSGKFRKAALDARVPRGCTGVSLEVVAQGSSGRVLVDDAFLLPGGDGKSALISVPEYPSAAILEGGPFFSVFQNDSPRILRLGPVFLPPGSPPKGKELLLSMELWAFDPRGKGVLLLGPAGEKALVSVKAHPGEEGIQVEWSLTGEAGGERPVLAWAFSPDPRVAEIPGPRGKGIRAVRLKTRTDAVLLAWKEPEEVNHLAGPGGIGLGWRSLPAGPLTIKVGFRKDWVLGKALLRKAAEARAAGEFGRAMVLLRKLMEDVPYNEKDLEKARALYGRLLEGGQKALDELKKAAERASLLMAPGELKALLARLEEFRKKYEGEETLCGQAGKIEADLRGALLEIEKKEKEKERKRLQGVLESLGPEAKALRSLVQEYIRTRLGPAGPGKD